MIELADVEVTREIRAFGEQKRLIAVGMFVAIVPMETPLTRKVARVPTSLT